MDLEIICLDDSTDQDVVLHKTSVPARQLGALQEKKNEEELRRRFKGLVPARASPDISSRRNIESTGSKPRRINPVSGVSEPSQFQASTRTFQSERSILRNADIQINSHPISSERSVQSQGQRSERHVKSINRNNTRTFGSVGSHKRTHDRPVDSLLSTSERLIHSHRGTSEGQSYPEILSRPSTLERHVPSQKITSKRLASPHQINHERLVSSRPSTSERLISSSSVTSVRPFFPHSRNPVEPVLRTGDRLDFSNDDDNQTIVLLSDSSDGETEERISSPSIITEISPSATRILEVTTPPLSRKRLRDEHETFDRQKRLRAPSPDPSVIIVSPPNPSSSFSSSNLSHVLRETSTSLNISTDTERSLNPKRRDTRPVQGRRIDLVQVEKPSPEFKESTSEKYLKQFQNGLDSHNQEKDDSPSTNKPSCSRSSVEELTPDTIRVTTEKSKSSKPPSNANSDNEGSNDVKNSACLDVKTSVELFLKTCKTVLPSSEFVSVEKKMMKYLNCISPYFLKSVRLKNFIEMRWGLLDSDHKNVYVQIRDVLEELKTYRQEGRSGTTSDLSDSNISKKKVSVTTIHKPLRKCPPERVVEGEHAEIERDILSVLNLAPTGSGSTSVQGTIASSSSSQIFNQNLTNPSPTPSLSKTVPVQSKDAVKTPSKRHIRKLEKALSQCEREIRKLEDSEVNFEDDDESVYILEAKYKKRYMDIYKKLAAYRKLSANLERRSDKAFKFDDSRFPEINVKISKFVNRTKQFPDFVDVKKLVEEVNSKQNLGLLEVQIHTESERIFQSVGKKLKMRRNNDEFDSICSYFKEFQPVDPATTDPELENKLQAQAREGRKKIDKVFEEYVEKQVNKKKTSTERKGNNDSEVEDREDEDEVEDDDEVSEDDNNGSEYFDEDEISEIDKSEESKHPEDKSINVKPLGNKLETDLKLIETKVTDQPVKDDDDGESIGSEDSEEEEEADDDEELDDNEDVDDEDENDDGDDIVIGIGEKLGEDS